MRKLYLYSFLMTILAISMSQCPSEQTPKVFSNSLSQTTLCVPDINIIENCEVYNLNAQSAPYSCLVCPTGFNKVKFNQAINQVNQICEDQSGATQPNCKTYNNEDDLQCIECLSGFNTFPIKVNGDGQTVVKCRLNRKLMIGDNVLWSTCKFYNRNNLSKCNTCFPFTGAKTNTPRSRDCSDICDVASGTKKSAYFYGLVGETTNSQCRNQPKPTCKRYNRNNWRGCNQCFQGDQLVNIRKNGRQYKSCVPKQQLISGCERYKEYGTRTDKNFLYFCFTCYLVGTENITYYEQHRSCITGADDIIGKCQKFKLDNATCGQCEHGYILKYERGICIKRIQNCAQYSEVGICIRCILPKYFLLGQTCLPKSQECLAVNELTGKCQQCITGFVPSEEELGACSISTICPNGQYYDVVKASCQPGTIQHCLVYPQGGIICLECEEDYNFNFFFGICELVTKEIICTAESVAVQGVCKQLSVGCIQYRISHTTGNPICEFCSDEFYHLDGKCFLKIQ